MLITEEEEAQALALLEAALPELVFRPVRQSKLLDYLPAVYHESEFLGRFLCIFEDSLRPLRQLMANQHYYFSPLTAPPEMVDWLATWVDLSLNESWSLAQRRRLIHSATQLYGWRGTRRGLIEYLKLYTGIEPDIAEYVDGMSLGTEALLGLNTSVAGSEDHSFTVTLHLDAGLSEEELAHKEMAIRRIIETEKPAHTAYQLRLIVGDSLRPLDQLDGPQLTSDESQNESEGDFNDAPA